MSAMWPTILVLASQKMISNILSFVLIFHKLNSGSSLLATAAISLAIFEPRNALEIQTR